MKRSWNVVAATIVLALPLSGCRGAPAPDAWPLGTCVLVDERGTTAVGCFQPHTHKVIAIAPTPEACPVEADMVSQPADPDDGLTTICFRSHTAIE